MEEPNPTISKGDRAPRLSSRQKRFNLVSSFRVPMLGIMLLILSCLCLLGCRRRFLMHGFSCPGEVTPQAIRSGYPVLSRERFLQIFDPDQDGVLCFMEGDKLHDNWILERRIGFGRNEVLVHVYEYQGEPWIFERARRVYFDPLWKMRDREIDRIVLASSQGPDHPLLVITQPKEIKRVTDCFRRHSYRLSSEVCYRYAVLPDGKIEEVFVGAERLVGYGGCRKGIYFYSKGRLLMDFHNHLDGDPHWGSTLLINPELPKVVQEMMAEVGAAPRDRRDPGSRGTLRGGGDS